MEYLLIVDLSGALRADALHGKIENRELIRGAILSKSTLARKNSRVPGRSACSCNSLLAGLQGQRHGARTIHNAHDERLAAAVVEELFDGIAQEAGLPEAAEYLLEFRETLDEYRTVDRSAQCAADEGGARRSQARDGLIGAAFFGDL